MWFVKSFASTFLAGRLERSSSLVLRRPLRGKPNEGDRHVIARLLLQRCVQQRLRRRPQVLADERRHLRLGERFVQAVAAEEVGCCLLYTSDAADERSSVDLGGRRI